MKITVWQVECTFCGKKLTAVCKDELEKIRDEHEKECEGIKKLQELYKIPIDERTVLFKILDDGKKADRVRTFMKKNKMSIDELRNILDELEVENI